LRSQFSFGWGAIGFLLRRDAKINFMPKSLCYTISVIFALASIIFIGCWVRSYSSRDKIKLTLASDTKLAIFSTDGQTTWVVRHPNHERRLLATYLFRSDIRGQNDPPDFARKYVLPYWILVTVLAMLSAAPWHLVRFNLRTAFIAMTLTAVIMGGIATSN
jgi:hypothetical protein